MAAGVLLITAGILTMIYPFNTYVRLVKYLGPALILNSGILLALSYQFPKGSASKSWMLLKSVLDFAFALVLSFNPFLTFIAFPVLSGPLMVCSGLIKIIGGAVIKGAGRVWPVTLSAGILFLVFGVLLTRSSYGSAANVSDLAGLFSISLGILYLIDALRLHLPKNHSAF